MIPARWTDVCQRSRLCLSSRAAAEPARGAIIGAAVGGVAGAVIGAQMDRQREELASELEGARVERYGEGLLITFASGLLFDFDSSDVVRGAARDNLTNLAQSLRNYPDTEVLIVGHTDNSRLGSYNQGLSERRAAAARDYLVSQGVRRTASARWAWARASRSRPTTRTPAARRTAASRSRSSRARRTARSPGYSRRAAYRAQGRDRSPAVQCGGFAIDPLSGSARTRPPRRERPPLWRTPRPPRCRPDTHLAICHPRVPQRRPG
jgi:outer membrane protein OmpA-like peptidoglycan-associated protein